MGSFGMNQGQRNHYINPPGARVSPTTLSPSPKASASCPAAAARRRPANRRHGRVHLRVPQLRRRVDGQAALRRDRGLRRHPLRAAAPPRRRRLRGRLRIRRPVLLRHGLPQLRRLPGDCRCCRWRCDDGQWRRCRWWWCCIRRCCGRGPQGGEEGRGEGRER